MIDLLREISQTLKHNKLRTALTGIAVTWGIFMLIVLLGVARGVTNNFDYEMGSRNTAQLRVWGGTTSVSYKGNREGRRIIMEDGDMTILPEQNHGFVKNVISRINGSGKISTSKAVVSTSYSGVYPEEFVSGRHGDITEGRFINEHDMQRKEKVMVIPQYYASQLFPPDGKKRWAGD